MESVFRNSSTTNEVNAFGFNCIYVWNRNRFIQNNKLKKTTTLTIVGPK